MKKIGIFALIIGLVSLVATLGMDTSVASGYGRIHNIGLMNEKQNFLLVSVAMSIVGVVLLIFGYRNKQLGETSNNATRTCPFCAEQILAQAILCRYCHRDITPLTPVSTGEENQSDLSKKTSTTRLKIDDKNTEIALNKAAKLRLTRGENAIFWLTLAVGVVLLFGALPLGVLCFIAAFWYRYLAIKDHKNQIVYEEKLEAVSKSKKVDQESSAEG